MKSFVLRLLLVVSLLCDFLGSGIGVKAQGYAANRSSAKEQIHCQDDKDKSVAEEPESPLCNVIRESPTSHRVAPSRPVRLLPTHGGKPTHQHGRWAACNISNLLKHVPLNLWRSQVGLHTAFTSPRYYYVIALRRILC